MSERITIKRERDLRNRFPVLLDGTEIGGYVTASVHFSRTACLFYPKGSHYKAQPWQYPTVAEMKERLPGAWATRVALLAEAKETAP